MNTHFGLLGTLLTLVQGLAFAGHAVPSVRVAMPDEPGAITRRAVHVREGAQLADRPRKDATQAWFESS
ncbi:MAG TPA: hypothetical protein PK640_06170 [Verrucomicrobiota bacterium]|nr:hypothetical protein [Verrucomicrobiota bacterium]